jgi:hypothetical protein
MFGKFQDALQSIDSSLTNKMGSSTFRSDVSGAGVNFYYIYYIRYGNASKYQAENKHQEQR